MLPFIKKHHKNDNNVFWPDLASSHYANSVQEWLINENIPFVAKKDNSANVPEACPIEDFWAFLKRRVYKNGWSAKNLDQLEKK